MRPVSGRMGPVRNGGRQAMAFGERLQEVRRRAGLTQEQFAAELNVSRQAVSKWERGICCPDIALLDEIADLFGMSIDMFLRGATAGAQYMEAV